MSPEANQKALVAMDLGAQSCRVSLLRWNRGIPQIEVVHRFENGPVQDDGKLFWDIGAIYEGLQRGLERCSEIATEGITSIAVDGWAVDYVRLDKAGNAVGPPFCYRDARTERAEASVHSLLPPSRLYALTGIQILRINTLYQLYADKAAGCDRSLLWVNLPEYIAYRLSGKLVSEFTNATHTGLVEMGSHAWCQEIFGKLGLEEKAAPKIVPTGSVLGPVHGAISDLPGFREAQVVVPACHDTASAIAAIPAIGDDWAFISSGTWSLVGTVLGSACVTDEARESNFTNLGGVGGKFYFLKNVNGLWILRQCLEEWRTQGFQCSLEELIEGCSSLPAPMATIDIDDPQLMLPGDAIRKINEQLEKLGQPTFRHDRRSIFPLASIVFHSMAKRYGDVLASIQKITGKKLKRLYIVGGGSRNRLLNQLTADRTGLEVTIGATESTTIGNFAIQMACFDSDWKSSSGVTARSVAKWAELITANAGSVAKSGDGNAVRPSAGGARVEMETQNER